MEVSKKFLHAYLCWKPHAMLCLRVDSLIASRCRFIAGSTSQKFYWRKDPRDHWWLPCGSIRGWKKTKKWWCAWIATVWLIWLRRNDFIFNIGIIEGKNKRFSFLFARMENAVGVVLISGVGFDCGPSSMTVN